MTDVTRPRFHGRRHGRRLRTGRERLLQDLLPQIQVTAEGRIEQPRALFDPPVERCWLEIGFGGGEHIAAQAWANPAVGLIGCEPFINGVARLLGLIVEGDIRNIRIYPDDARLLLPRLPERSIDRAFVLFPDPWPKKRHADRRIVSPALLDELARVLTDGACLRLASDDPGCVRWMLQQLHRHPEFEWTARAPSDWQERPPDWPTTRYEEKARADGRRCVFLTYLRRVRGERA